MTTSPLQWPFEARSGKQQESSGSCTPRCLLIVLPVAVARACGQEATRLSDRIGGLLTQIQPAGLRTAGRRNLRRRDGSVPPPQATTRGSSAGWRRHGSPTRPRRCRSRCRRR
ncbi:hypothetical protein GCM10020358_71290 [Amorphoplanes nipponensis]